MPKARTCQKCGSAALLRRSTTYPLLLAGQQINVERVKLHQCSDCGHLMPTPEGQAKLDRAVQVVVGILEKAKK